MMTTIQMKKTTINNKKTAPKKSGFFYLYNMASEEMEGSASKDIASIEPKLRSGSWIDKLVIIVINLDIFLRIKVKEIVHPKGKRGLWSKVIRYGKVSDYFSTDYLVSPLIEYKISYLVSSSDDIRTCSLAIISIAQVAIPFSYGKIVRKSSFEARDYLFQKYSRALGEEFFFKSCSLNSSWGMYFSYFFSLGKVKSKIIGQGELIVL